VADGEEGERLAWRDEFNDVRDQAEAIAHVAERDDNSRAWIGGEDQADRVVSSATK
jgi:hypothetical protein